MMTFFRKLRSVFGRARRDAEIREELAFHLDEEMAEARAAGLSDARARQSARRDLGNVAVVEEDTRAAWRWRWLEHLAQDVGYALRMMRRRRGFTVAAVVSLTLGIGANVALFSLLHALLLERLPVRRPHELVQLTQPRPQAPAPYEFFVWNWFRDLEAAAPKHVSIAAATIPGINNEIERNGTRYRVATQLVSDNFFDVLGLDAAAGRVFHRPQDGVAGEPVAVISDAFWRRHYGGAEALGSRFRYGRYDVAVVGILPAGFKGLSLEADVDVWLRFDHVIPRDSDDRAQGRWAMIIGRLTDGVTAAQATAQAAAVLGRPVAFRPGSTPYSSLRTRLYRPLLLVELVVVLVLAITCANLANLTLAGNLARERELAVRRALGAARARLVRQLLTETAVIALAGGVLAVVIASWVSGALLAYLPPVYAAALPDLRFELNATLLAFAIGTTVLTTLIVGLLPALRASRGAASAELRVRTVSGDRARTWTNRGLVVGQVAMCSLLLMLSGVFLRTVQNLRGQDAGYEERHLLSAELGCPRGHGEDRCNRAFEDIRARAAAIPGVTSAAYSHVGQLSGFALTYRIAVPGRVVDPNDVPEAYEQRVSTGYLAAMGTRLLSGRDFTDADTASSRQVAIVNQAFARQILGDQAVVIGREFTRANGAARPPIEIVGVVQDTKWVDLRSAEPAMYYRPYAQEGGTPSVRFAIRTLGEPEAHAAAFTAAVGSVDRLVAVANVVPFGEIVNRSLLIERLVAQVSAAFSALALLVAAIGLYGVLAYSVTRRRREIGVRIAVGASPGSVERMFLRESFALLAAGLAIGVPAAVAVIRVVSSMLYGVGPQDPSAIAMVTAVLALATAAAAYLPARRAAAIDPIIALREE